MPEPGYVFINYARADREFVDRLSRDLMVAGIPLWRDVDNIRPGTNWQKEIESAVSTADGLIYVASRNAAESPWIKHELQLMLDRSETRVFPLILDDAGANRLPAFLQRIQWVDSREGYLAARSLLDFSLALQGSDAPRDIDSFLEWRQKKGGFHKPPPSPGDPPFTTVHPGGDSEKKP